jgi:AcrR family transcriptional regulator
MPKDTFFNLPEEKRERLLNIALDEFAHRPYKAASVSRIVDKAGIAKGSFYQYFENKQDLYRYLLDIAVQTKREFVESQQAPDPTMDIFAYLSWLLRQSVRFELAYPHLTQLGYRAVYQDNHLPGQVIEQAKANSLTYFRSLVTQGIAQNSIDPNLDPEVAAFVFNAVFSELGRFLLTQLEVDSAEMAESGHFPLEHEALPHYFDQVLRVLEHGLRGSGGQ